MGSALLYANPEGDALEDIVNVSQYPVGNVQNAGGSVNESWADMVATTRRALAADGCATLPGFLTDEGLRRARSEISSLMPKAPLRHETSSVYARSDLEVGLAPDDPRQIQMSRLIGHLTRDQIPPDVVLARVYAAPGVKQFVAACVGEVRAFEYADPLAGLVVTVTPPGGELHWHYDTNEFVVTLMVAEPDSGGDFENVSQGCSSTSSPRTATRCCSMTRSTSGTPPARRTWRCTRCTTPAGTHSCLRRVRSLCSSSRRVNTSPRGIPPWVRCEMR